MTRRPHGPDPAMLAALVDGEVTASERATLENDLRQSPEARAQLAQLHRIRDSLSGPVPELTGHDLVAGVRGALARGEGPQRPMMKRRVLAVIAPLAACAAAAALFWGPLDDASDDTEFRVKAAAGVEGGRWTGIRVFRLDRAGHPERVGAELSSSDPLLFSYTNLGTEPFTHLMIFSVDASGAIRWFHPPYEDAGVDPESMRIERTENPVTLPELVEHEFAPGPLSIYGLFTRRSVRVSEVEQWVRSADRLDRAPLPDDAHLAIVRARVGP